MNIHLPACTVPSIRTHKHGYMTVRAFASFMLAMSSLSWASAQPQPGSAPQWQIYASCSAAYYANWQIRQSTRSQDMSSMIQEQFADYKAKAIGFYENELKVQQSEAAPIVDAYVAVNVDRFIAMEKAGTLEAYIDQCPAN